MGAVMKSIQDDLDHAVLVAKVSVIAVKPYER